MLYTNLFCPPVSLSLLGFLRVANSFKLALIYLCLKLIIGLPTLCLLYTRSTQHTDVTISPPHIGGQRLRYLSGSVCPLVPNTKDRLSWILKHRMHRSVCSPYGWEFCTF
ncbi:hypothetical protein PNOK_0694800 [Pyrrhoderma noxium]|uniref:Uncharacterized protein n=1 Tax=Pyrrhoderma noxium TaxID=2282107 RepID=A0A286UBI0_9AGAM|nr:hypothetical protein PNOK_0694800 [Pyrrhoderma noxium]